MKTSLFFIVTFFTHTVFACVNFSGKYQDPRDLSTFEIVQTACEHLKIITQENEISFKVDGNFHRTIEEEIVIDGEKVGTFFVSHKAIFGNVDVHIESLAHYEVNGKAEDHLFKDDSSLNSNGDIVSNSELDGRSVETVIMKKLD
jgi:hypothetical protein